MATRIQKFKRRLMLLGLLLIAVIAAAPTIVSRSSLHNSLLARAMPPGWRVESESAALSWMGFQKLHGVTITDAEGKPLLTAESVTLPRTLISRPS